MGETDKGFRSGFGQGAGCCTAIVAIPCVAMVLLLFACQQGAKQIAQSAEIKAKQREAEKLVQLKWEREEKLQAAGLAVVPDVPVQSAAEMRKQMRIEGIKSDAGFADAWADAGARREAVQPLKDAAAALMQGREDEVQMLEELAGVVKGESIVDVMHRFDAPDRRGETNEVLKYSQGWPDMMYYSYNSADVTFLVTGGKVELILVGLAYPEAVR